MPRVTALPSTTDGRAPRRPRHLLTALAAALLAATASIMGGVPAQAATVQWLQVSAGEVHTCAVGADHSLWCWGENWYGDLGTGEAATFIASVPVRVGRNADWLAVAAGNQHTCALKLDGSRYCWGANSRGQLGLGDTTDRSAPRRIISEGGVWASLSAGGNHTCGIKKDGRLYCWGENATGVLGVGDQTQRTLPTPVVPGTSWSQVQTGRDHTCALSSSGTRYCWGADWDGRLGLGGDGTRVLSPRRLAGEGAWSVLATGASSSCGIDTAKRLFCWGDNVAGQLGLGDTVSRAKPNQVGTSTGWSRLTVGYRHACATRGDSKRFCWGSGSSGQLGLGSRTSSTSPVSVFSAPWEDLSAGGAITCGVKATVLYCWGEGYLTGTGRGTGTYVLNPARVTAE